MPQKLSKHKTLPKLLKKINDLEQEAQSLKLLLNKYKNN